MARHRTHKTIFLVVLSVLVAALVGRVAADARISGGDRVRELGLCLLLAARRVFVPFNVEQTVDQTADDDQYDLKDAQGLLLFTGSDDPANEENG